MNFFLIKTCHFVFNSLSSLHVVVTWLFIEPSFIYFSFVDKKKDSWNNQNLRIYGNARDSLVSHLDNLSCIIFCACQKSFAKYFKYFVARIKLARTKRERKFETQKSHKIRLRKEDKIKAITPAITPLSSDLPVFLSTPWNRRSIQMSSRRNLTDPSCCRDIPFSPPFPPTPSLNRAS